MFATLIRLCWHRCLASVAGSLGLFSKLRQQCRWPPTTVEFFQHYQIPFGPNDLDDLAFQITFATPIIVNCGGASSMARNLIRRNTRRCALSLTGCSDQSPFHPFFRLGELLIGDIYSYGPLPRQFHFCILWVPKVWFHLVGNVLNKFR